MTKHLKEDDDSMSGKFDPEAVLGKKRFGSVSIRQNPSKLYDIRLKINGETYTTPSFENRSDLLWFVYCLQQICGQNEHLKMGSDFKSPFTSHGEWVETRTVELEMRDRERQEDEEEQEESPAEGSAEEDPALSIAKKLAAAVHELVGQTDFVSRPVIVSSDTYISTCSHSTTSGQGQRRRSEERRLQELPLQQKRRVIPTRTRFGFRRRGDVA